MSDASRRPVSSRPYASRPIAVRAARPIIGAAPVGGNAGLGGALGAIGGTLGCLLCLAAIGALGLFACTIAVAAYTGKFLTEYKRVEGISGAAALHMGALLLLASLFYTVFCRIQRS